METVHKIGPWVLISYGTINLLMAGPIYGPLMRLYDWAMKLDVVVESQDTPPTSVVWKRYEKIEPLICSRWWIASSSIPLYVSGIAWFMLRQ